MPRKLISLALCLLLAACSPPQTPPPAAAAVQAWFDMPLPGTVFYPPNPCKVIAHGASSKGIALFELYVNGALASGLPASDSNGTLAVLNTTCPGLVPGRNLLEVRAKDSSGQWSGLTQTTVFLRGENPPGATPLPRPTATRAPTLRVLPTLTAAPLPTSTATRIPAATPTFTSTPRPAGGVTVERISTDLVYLGRADCGPLEVTITARASAPDGIRVVVLFYRFETGSSSSGFEALSMQPIGGDLFESTLNPTRLLGGSVPFDSATLQYQVVIQETDGDTTLRTPVLADISVRACGGVTTSCTIYTDERSCLANGCAWVPIPGTVPRYACQNP